MKEFIKPIMQKEDKFTVEVNNEHYNVEPIISQDETNTQYRVSTSCEYMFTLRMSHSGSWEMEKDVTAMYPELIRPMLFTLYIGGMDTEIVVTHHYDYHYHNEIKILNFTGKFHTIICSPFGSAMSILFKNNGKWYFEDNSLTYFSTSAATLIGNVIDRSQSSL